MDKACWTPSSTVPGLLPWQSYALAFVLGIVAWRFPLPALACLAVVWFADLSFRSRSCRLPVLVFVCCAAFGFGYASQRVPEIPDTVPAWMQARERVVVRAVAERVEPRPDQRLRVVLGNVVCRVEDKEFPLPGKVAWSIRSAKYRPSPGQSVEAILRVVPVRGFGNPGSWDYGWYWQRQGVFWRAWSSGKVGPRWGEPPQDVLWQIKKRLRRVVAEAVPDTQGGAMVLALTTGDRSRLESGTMDATRSAGLAHVLALSGLHVGFVAALGFGLALLVGWIYPPLFLFVPRPRLAVLMAAPLVLGYAWLGQPSASLVRAAVMFAFWGFLLLQGRGRVLMDGLFFALVTIVFVSPLSVFDLSLQMSMTAVAGIGIMYPHFRAFLPSGRTWVRRALVWAGGVLSISLCANFALMPLVSWYFGTVSPNILLNLVWLPVIGGIVMPLGLVGMLLSILPWTVPVGSLLLSVAAQCADWLLVLLHWVNGTGWTPVFAVLRPLWPEMLGCVLLLIIAASVAGSSRRVPVGLAALGFVLLVSPHVFVMASDARDETRLTMLDVGLGQSLVLALPGGHRWLIDGGGGSRSFDLGEAVVAPALTRGRPPRLDGVFMTHPDVDHSHGLSFILGRFDVGPFYTNGMLPRGVNGKRMKSVLALRAIAPSRLLAGEEVRLDENTVFEVLHPHAGFVASRANERSLVLRLVRDGKPLALLPGDVEKSGIECMMRSGKFLTANVLVLPHHGSRSSYDRSFYEAVSADIVLCSNGYLNRYGFPAQEVVEGVGEHLLTTSRYGQVSCVWTPESVTVEPFYP